MLVQDPGNVALGVLDSCNAFIKVGGAASRGIQLTEYNASSTGAVEGVELTCCAGLTLIARADLGSPQPTPPPSTCASKATYVHVNCMPTATNHRHDIFSP